MADFSLTAVFGMDASGMKTELKTLRKEVASFATDWAKIGAGAAVAAFAMLSKGAMELAGSLSDASANIGINVESLQALQQQHKRNGVSNEELVAALQKTKAAVLDAADGNVKAEQALNRLHLTSSKLLSLPLDKQYAAIAKAVAEAKNQSEAYSAVSDLLGSKVGPRLMGSLKELGETGLPGVTKSAKEAGHVMASSTIAALDAAGDAIDDFKQKATIWAGEIIVNFRTAEGLKLIQMQIMQMLSMAAGRVLDAVTEAGEIITKVVGAAFSGVVYKFHNGLISAVQDFVGLVNKALPKGLRVNTEDLDMLKVRAESVGDLITKAIASTSPSRFMTDFGASWDSAIEEQKKVVAALNAVDFKEPIKNLKGTLEKPIPVQPIPPVTFEPIPIKPLQAVFDSFLTAMGGIRGGADFNTASDEALRQIAASNRSKAAALNPFGISTTSNVYDRQEAARLATEAANAEAQLKMRADLRYNYAQGGAAAVYRNMSNIDPIALDGLIKQFAQTLPQTERTALAIEQIARGLTGAGIIQPNR